METWIVAEVMGILKVTVFKWKWNCYSRRFDEGSPIWEAADFLCKDAARPNEYFHHILSFLFIS